MPIVTIHGQPAHYDVSGDENAQALVLIHGSGGAARAGPLAFAPSRGPASTPSIYPGTGRVGEIRSRPWTRWPRGSTS